MNLPMPSSIAVPAINHLLADEKWARDKLLPHAGKLACFDCGIARIELLVLADGQVGRGEQGTTPAVTIRVKAGDLPLIAQDTGRAFSYVTIEGDADFANAISQVAQSLRWDAEDDLSKLFGDVAATRMVAGAKAGFATLKTTQRKLAENVAEYLLEENPVLVRAQHVSDFGAEVARLRDDVERLLKRLEKLEGQHR
jgi:ubiquinone biosynthesis protein UbiJ